jgi:hypothetical protein
MVLEMGGLLATLGGAASAIKNHLKSKREESGGEVTIASIDAQVAAAAERARAIQANQAGAAAAAAQAAQDAQAASAASARYEQVQAVADAAYLIAAADGAVSAAESGKIGEGLRQHLGEEVGGSVPDLLEVSRQRLADHGQKGLAEAIASAFPDVGLRRAVFMVAAGVSWLDRGIGVKEGLALQAVSGAFGIPMKEMHELLGAAKKG